MVTYGVFVSYPRPTNKIIDRQIRQAAAPAATEIGREGDGEFRMIDFIVEHKVARTALDVAMSVADRIRKINKAGLTATVRKAGGDATA